MTYSDLTCPRLTYTNMTCPWLLCSDKTCPNLTCLYFTYPGLTLHTLFRYLPDTFQTPSRNLTEPSRYLPDTLIKTPSRHPPDILYIPLRPLDTRTLTYGHLYTFQVRRCGWVDFTPIIKPLRGPTCMLKTSKISTQVEIASWARVWQLQLSLRSIGQYVFTAYVFFSKIHNFQIFKILEWEHIKFKLFCFFTFFHQRWGGGSHTLSGKFHFFQPFP